MTYLAKALLEKIKNDDLFAKHDFIFVGGTALSHHINHRVSEDLDFAFASDLPIFDIRSFALRHGGQYLPDPKASAFRINTGLDLDAKYMKFLLDGVKVEFFFPNDPVSQACLSGEVIPYDNSNIKLLNVNDIAKMKVKALMDRIKIRDIFDITEILKRNILNNNDFFTVAQQYTQKDEIAILERISNFKEQVGDESLYFSDGSDIPSFNNLKSELYNQLNKYIKSQVLLRETNLIDVLNENGLTSRIKEIAAKAPEGSTLRDTIEELQSRQSKSKTQSPK